MSDSVSFSTLYNPREVAQTVARRARDLRISRRKTQTELASATGLGRSTISRFERGDDVAFSVVVAVAFALGAEAMLLELFTEVETRSFDELVDDARRPQRVRKRDG